MHGTLHRILVSCAVAAFALIAAGCTPSGAATGGTLSDGYQAPLSGTPVDQTESMRSHYRDWLR